jgi:hypothetical protein
MKKKTFYGRRDRRTDGRKTQNYSSEPHNKKKTFYGQTDGQTKNPKLKFGTSQ